LEKKKGDWRKTTHFYFYLFEDGGGAFKKKVICFLILRLPNTPKNVRVFWKLFPIALQTKISLPGRQARSKADKP